MAKDFLPKVITWFRLDEHVRRLKEFIESLTTRVETLENAPSGGGGAGTGVESVTGDSVDNTDPLNPIINAIPLSGTTEGNPVTGDIEYSTTFANEYTYPLIYDFITDIYAINLRDDGCFGLKKETVGDNTTSVYVSNELVELRNTSILGFDTILSLKNTGVELTTNNPTSKGISSLIDFTNNITDLDYTQKKYVDQKVADSRPYKVYTALLTQSGTDTLVATVLENTLGDIVWTRNNIGSYRANLAGVFTEGKTFVFVGATEDGEDNGVDASLGLRTTDSIVNIRTGIGTTTSADYRLRDTPIEIRVYN